MNSERKWWHGVVANVVLGPFFSLPLYSEVPHILPATSFFLSLNTEHNLLVWKANCSGRAITPWCYRTWVIHIVDSLGSRRMETAPTFIDVLLRPTLCQSDEPSDLHASLSPATSLHACPSVYSTGSPRRSPIQLWTGPSVA